MQTHPPRFVQDPYNAPAASTQDMVCRFDLTRLHSERSSGMQMRAEFVPAKFNSTKSVIPSQGMEIMGLTRTSMRLVACQFGYTRFYVTARKGHILDHAANRWGRAVGPALNKRRRGKHD